MIIALWHRGTATKFEPLVQNQEKRYRVGNFIKHGLDLRKGAGKLLRRSEYGKAVKSLLGVPNFMGREFRLEKEPNAAKNKDIGKLQKRRI